MEIPETLAITDFCFPMEVTNDTAIMDENSDIKDENPL